MAASDVRIKALARFVVAFGTEEDAKWRDYNLDLAAHDPIRYDDVTGIPIHIDPVEDSGYSVGSVQLDFGQQHSAVPDFLDAFKTWHDARPGTLPLASSYAAAAEAMKRIGRYLRNHPSAGLRKQDVDALSAWVRSPEGSDWVNDNIDRELFGDANHLTYRYHEPNEQAGKTLFAVARSIENKACFVQNAQDSSVTDMLYAMTMKCYNQRPATFSGDLWPFLDSAHDKNDIIAWPDHLPPTLAVKGGVTNAITYAKFFSWLGAQAEPWIRDLANVMETQCDANPRKISRTNGAYVAAKVAFSYDAVFKNFIAAVRAGPHGRYRPGGYFLDGGSIVVKADGPIHEGVLVQDGTAYVWNTASNAYKLTGNTWTDILVTDIHCPRMPGDP